MKNFLKSMFPPRWKSKDTRERLEAVREMDASATEILEEVALTDDENNVRLAACARIDDPKILRGIASTTQDDAVKRAATERADEILRERVLSADDWERALTEVSNQGCICKILLTTDNLTLRIAAAERLTDHDVIMTALTGECGKDVGMQLLEKVDSDADLEALSANGGNKAIRHAAQDRLDARRKPVETDEEAVEEDTTDEDLTEIVDYAESVTQTYNFDGVGKLLEERKAQWNLLDPDHSHALYARFETATKTFDDRRAAFEAKQAAKKEHEAAQRQLTEEKEAIVHALESLEPAADNAGSEVEGFVRDWENVPALEDEEAEEALGNRFKMAEATITSGILALAKETEEMESLAALCDKLEGIVNEPTEAELKKNRNRTWREPKWKHLDATPLKQRFDAAIDAIGKALDAMNAARGEEQEKRSAELKTIVESIRQQVDAENRRDASKKVKELQERWKALGGWNESKLAAEFKTALDAFWEKQREFLEDREWAEWHNKGVKDKLIAAVEATAEMEDARAVAKIIREAQKKWKEVGPVPHKVSDEMWDRFHAACDANYERCKEFFAEKEKEREENLQVCLKLCEEAEALSASEKWGTAARRFRDMQQEWKSHGSLPREKADETYARFRTACDAFFSRFGEHREDIDAHREENQAAKEELVARANALLESDKPITSPDACIALQKKWKGLGPGLKKKDEDTWAAFREACDKFFGQLEAEHEKHVPDKEALCDEVEALVGDSTDDAERQKSADKIIDIQKRWNALGPLPKSYKGDAEKRFSAACDIFFGHQKEEYAEIGDERERNLAIKRDLVAKAEALAESTDWRETAAELKLLQAEWKTVGHVPRKHDNEVWRAFRAACDAFFSKRKAHFDTMDSRRQENLVAKEELLVELEQLIGKADDEKAAEESNSGLDLAGELQAALESNFAMASGGQSKHDEIRRIQEHWKAIGPVPREKDKDLWNRYRSLLDRFYGNKR